MPERSILFGPSGQLVGTICAPSLGVVRRRVGILLFNAGVIHRIGPHRLNVRLARALAGDGFASIRFDLGGQGDSPRPLETRSPKDQVMADIKAAMDALAENCLVTDFVLFGFCSGGYHGYDAVAADPRIRALVMFDAFLYQTWRSELTRYRMRIAEKGLGRACRDWLERQFSRVLGHGDKAGSTPGRDREDRTAYTIGIPAKAEFAKTIREYLDRGVKVHMIYAGQGFEKYSYAGQFADAFRPHGIADRVSTHFFPDTDHAVTDLAAQRDLIEHVRSWVVANMATS